MLVTVTNSGQFTIMFERNREGKHAIRTLSITNLCTNRVPQVELGPSNI